MTTTHSDGDLLHALASRARATSDGRLVVAVVAGLAAALAIAVWRPPAWLVLASGGMCVAAFGAWGIADRELAERPRTSGMPAAALRTVRLLSLVLGATAAIVTVLNVLGMVLGTWIS